MSEEQNMSSGYRYHVSTNVGAARLINPRSSQYVDIEKAVREEFKISSDEEMKLQLFDDEFRQFTDFRSNDRAPMRATLRVFFSRGGEFREDTFNSGNDIEGNDVSTENNTGERNRSYSRRSRTSSNERIRKSHHRRPDNTKTILLVGCCGAGKSTFANAVCQYLRYDTFEDAENAELCLPVGTKTTIYDPSTDCEKLISASNGDGRDDNERSTVDEDGDYSWTIKPQTYSISSDDYDLDIIDTPGLADEREGGVGGKSLPLIAAHVAAVRTIHCIIVVLKSTDIGDKEPSLLALRQIISVLPSSIQGNVIFCYTHARSANYRAAKEAKAFKSYMTNVKLNAENKVYYVDNEVVPYLIALKNQPGFDLTNDRQLAKISWEHSAAQVKKIMTQICSLHTVPINDLNARVMASACVINTSRVMRTFIEKVSDAEKCVQAMQTSRDVYRENYKATFKNSTYYQTHLPRTVVYLTHPPNTFLCRSPDCSETVNNILIPKVCKKQGNKFFSWGGGRSECRTCKCSMDQHREASYYKDNKVPTLSSSYDSTLVESGLAKDGRMQTLLSEERRAKDRLESYKNEVLVIMRCCAEMIKYCEACCVDEKVIAEKMKAALEKELDERTMKLYREAIIKASTTQIEATRVIDNIKHMLTLRRFNNLLQDSNNILVQPNIELRPDRNVDVKRHE
jgi:GTPase SAR1 family protein